MKERERVSVCVCVCVRACYALETQKNLILVARNFESKIVRLTRTRVGSSKLVIVKTFFNHGLTQK